MKGSEGRRIKVMREGTYGRKPPLETTRILYAKAQREETVANVCGGWELGGKAQQQILCLLVAD